MKKIVALLTVLMIGMTLPTVQASQIGQPANVTGLTESGNNNGSNNNGGNNNDDLVTAINYHYDGLVFNMVERDERFSNQNMALDFHAAGSMITFNNEYITFWLVDVTNVSNSELTYADMLHYDTVLYVEDENGVAENVFFYYLPVTIEDDLSFEYVDYEDAETLQDTVLEPNDTNSFLFYTYVDEIPENGRSFLDVHGEIIVEGFPFNY